MNEEQMISVEKLKDRIFKYRDELAERSTVTDREFKVMNAALFGVISIIADMIKQTKPQSHDTNNQP